jgi:hypothetical protein
MALIIKGSRKNPTPPPKPPDFGPPPKSPPKDWEKKWKFRDLLDRQNPMMSLTAAEILTHTRTAKDETKKDEDADDAKKKARVAAIIAANRAKRRSKGNKTSNVSGTGTVTPLLYSYPGAYAEEGTGGGFSMSDIPSIVWVVLAVAGGVFLIKSARKR